MTDEPRFEDTYEYILANAIKDLLYADDTLRDIWSSGGGEWNWQVGILRPTPNDALPLFSVYPDLVNMALVSGGLMWEISYRMYFITAWLGMENHKRNEAYKFAITERIAAVHIAQIQGRYGLSTSGLDQIERNMRIETSFLGGADWPDHKQTLVIWRKHWFDMLYRV